MSDFVHLHLHTEYSLLDGAVRIKKIFGECKKRGMDTVAITDHGNMFGTLKFAEAAKQAGIKAIIGCEMYICDDYKDKTGKQNYDHIILLCKNKTGYKNLIKLDSIAYVDGFYYKPRIDYKTLAEHSEGLICLSACLAGRVQKRLVQNDYEGAKETALFLKSVFKDDFYLEIQDHGLADQKRINPSLIRLSKETGIPIVATNDVHYLNKEDAEMQDVIMCISMKTTIDDPNRLKMEASESYLKTPEEMKELFSYLPEAIENTVKIANKVTEEVFPLDDKGVPIKDWSLIPKYYPENGQTPKEYLFDLATKGLHRRYKEITKEIQDRFDYEFDVISSMGFCDYYLIVWDFINYAKSVGIPVGAGRGSGVSSIIAYSIGITDVEPLKYQLIFERFLNRERVSMPDFDVDISDARRGEVVEYVRHKYGFDKVAQIVTFGTLASKQAIKDVARVYRIPYADSDKITKLMDGKSTIKQSLGMENLPDGTYVGVQDLIDIYNSDPQLKKIIDMAIKVEGLPRNTSMHAAGVVICEKPIMNNVPLQRNGDDVTTQFDMIEVESLGMLKMDFLGLRTLTDVQDACKYVKEDFGKDLDFHEIGYEDQGAYELIGSGLTDAVFQLESPGMKKFMKELKPTTFEDIIAGISLYRPGPMDSIPQYIRNKHHPEDIVYDHPMMEPILKNSYGVLIYQEQVMQVCQQLGGFTLGHADIVRKAMGKKKIKIMDEQEEIFIHGGINEHTGLPVEGAVKRGVPEDIAFKIYEGMKPFARYAFNKSHAAAYAVLAYETAYLKKYYPTQFMTSILNNRIDKSDEISKYLAYLKSIGTKVYQPDINLSKAYYHTEGNGIRIGLVSLKNIGMNVINDIVNERDANGKYTSFEDFISRCADFGMNKRMIENLIYAGAFDCFGVKRSQLIAVYSGFTDKIIERNKKKASAQMSIFGTLIKDDDLYKLEYPDIPEYDSKYKLQKEKEVIGEYITGHPLADFSEQFSKYKFDTRQLTYYDEDENGDRTYTAVKEGDRVRFGGIITKFEKIVTKKNTNMGVMTVEDLYGPIECTLFSRTYEQYKNIAKEDEVVEIGGRLHIKDNRVSVNLDDLKLIKTEAAEKKEPVDQEYLGLIIPDKTLRYLDNILDVLTCYEGDIPVFISKEGKKFDAKCSVRKCDGLLSELSIYLDESDIVFFKKKK